MSSSSRRDPLRIDGQKRRDALLDATLSCFFRLGVQNTTIADIRREAEASPSSIYHQFEGIPGLTLALLTRTFERMFSHLSTRVRAADTAEGVVHALVGGHLEWVLGHPDEASVMYQAMSLGFSDTDAETLSARKADALLPVVQHFMTFMQNGTLPPLAPLEMEIVLLGPTHEACRRWLAGAPLDPDWMMQTLPRLAWLGVEQLADQASRTA